MSFFCTYCGFDHPDVMRSKEHIIPEYLGNKGYVHVSTCARINQGLARAVETPFHEQSTIKTILSLLDPPQPGGHRVLWKTTTADSGHEFVFLRHHRVEHGLAPQYSTFDTIQLPLRSRGGEHLTYSLRLPFALTNTATGSELLLTEKGVAKRFAKQEEALANYVQRLLQDPKIDPDFANFLEEHDVELTPLFFRVLLEKGTGSEGETVQLSRSYEINIEVAVRYFVKIALLFASKEVGPELRMTQEFDALRQYLIGFFVDPSLAVQPDGSPFPFFAEGMIAGERSFWWVSEMKATEVAINTSSSITPEQRGALLAENGARLARWNTIAHLLRFDRMGSLVLEDGELAPDRLYHELTLRSGSVGPSGPGFWCEIALFGGLFKVAVQLAPDMQVDCRTHQKRIKTPWYVDGQS